MTAQITEEQAISELSEMFPRFERGVLLTLLEVNGMNLSRTIEALLKVESDQSPPQGDVYVVRKKKENQPVKNDSKMHQQPFDPSIVYDAELAARLQEEEVKGIGANQEQQIDRAVRRSLRSVASDSDERVRRFLEKGHLFFKKPVQYFVILAKFQNEGGREVHEETISAKLQKSMWLYKSPRYVRK